MWLALYGRGDSALRSILGHLVSHMVNLASGMQVHISTGAGIFGHLLRYLVGLAFGVQVYVAP